MTVTVTLKNAANSVSAVSTVFAVIGRVVEKRLKTRNVIAKIKNVLSPRSKLS